MNSMKTNINNFATAAGTSLGKVKASADAATKSVKALQAAINALKDKTITIRVNLTGPGVGYLQHGGGFISGMEHGGAFIGRGQGGFSGIVDRPTTFKGVHMGEGFKPELVTVTPLTRGTGNHSGPTLGGGGGGNQPIINNITVVLDGRVIQRFVEKTALNNIGLQV